MRIPKDFKGFLWIDQIIHFITAGCLLITGSVAAMLSLAIYSGGVTAENIAQITEAFQQIPEWVFVWGVFRIPYIMMFINIAWVITILAILVKNHKKPLKEQDL